MATVLEAPERTNTKRLSPYETDRGKPMPSKLHALAQGNLYFLLRQLYGNNFEILPEIKVAVGSRELVPDLAIYPKFDEIDWQKDEIRMKELPLLTVEILSPKQSLDSLILKTESYFLNGVQSCWIVMPAIKTIVVYYQFGKSLFFHENDILKDPNLPIEIDLKEIFK